MLDVFKFCIVTKNSSTKTFQDMMALDNQSYLLSFGVLGHILGVQLPNLRRWHWMSRDGIMSKPYASFPRPELVPTTPPKSHGGCDIDTSDLRFDRQVPQIWGGRTAELGHGLENSSLLGTTGTKKEVWKILGCPWYLGSMVGTWFFFHLPINGIYWGYNPVSNFYSTVASRDIQIPNFWEKQNKP